MRIAMRRLCTARMSRTATGATGRTSLRPVARRRSTRRGVESVQVKNDPVFFAIIDAASNQPVGVASYLRIDHARGSIEVGHLSYSPALQRTVAATEAMALMMKRAFDELGYRRYEWKCDSLNAPSRRAAERLGFRYEGTFPQRRGPERQEPRQRLVPIIDSSGRRCAPRTSAGSLRTASIARDASGDRWQT